MSPKRPFAGRAMTGGRLVGALALAGALGCGSGDDVSVPLVSAHDRADAAPLRDAGLAADAALPPDAALGGGAPGPDAGAADDGFSPPVAALDALPAPAQPTPWQTHSGSIAADAAGSLLFVVHPDADSVSIVDVAARAVRREVLLASAHPALTAAGRYDPAVAPRALAVDATASTLYVTGQRSGRVYAVDVASGTVESSAAVCSEPVGVLVAPDGANVFVACAGDDEIVELRATDLTAVAAVPCPRKPWALAWA
ncbi:MAG: hypothetical protein JOZ69_20620, partial [Myxococcales bacterium]|nr:hypothetical protein [Myxococcales bacterium]